MPGDRSDSVFVAHWYPLQRLGAEETISQQDWALILQAKEAINKVIEEQRNQGLVKGSLGADIELFADQDLYNSLAKLGDELRFVTITSKALLRLEAEAGEAEDSMLEGLKIAVKHSDATKCVRCWHFIDDVGSNPDHPEVCGRCIDNIEGQGEVRAYA
jgi:isoleucyl-tRNA synthetase